MEFTPFQEEVITRHNSTDAWVSFHPDQTQFLTLSKLASSTTEI